MTTSNEVTALYEEGTVLLEACEDAADLLDAILDDMENGQPVDAGGVRVCLEGLRAALAKAGAA